MFAQRSRSFLVCVRFLLVCSVKAASITPLSPQSLTELANGWRATPTTGLFAVQIAPRSPRTERGEDGRKERPSELAIDLAARLLNSKTFLQIRERSELREDAYVAIIFTRLIIGNLVPTFIRWHNSGFHRGRRLNKPLVTLTTRRGKQECCDDYHVSLSLPSRPSPARSPVSPNSPSHARPPRIVAFNGVGKHTSTFAIHIYRRFG